MRSVVTRGILFVMGAALAGVDVMVGWAIVATTVYGLLSTGWKVTEGRIVESNVYHGGERVNSAYPELVYQYHVDGERYRGDRIRFEGVTSGASDAEVRLFLADDPVGESVEVHYDSDEPGRSVLQAGASVGGLFVGAGMGLVFLVPGALMMVFSVKSRRNAAGDTP